jgi:TetR/AcrR family transcriptional repressor of nem operon
MARNRSIDDDTVLERAAEMFWRKGYAATSIRDLADATGLGAAALYQRFADKERLFVEVLRRYADKGLAMRLARFSAVSDPVDAIAGFLGELVRLSVEDPDRRGCLLVNTALDGASVSPEARDLVRERLGEAETFFHVQLQRARDAGQLRPEIALRAAAEGLLGVMLAIRVLARIDPEADRLRRLVDNALAPLSPRRNAASDSIEPSPRLA